MSSLLRSLALSALLLTPRAAPAAVQLNEILADPSGSETTDEFVELLNTGPEAVDLAGWKLGDAGDVDGLLDLGQGLVLEAGVRAIVLDGGYLGGWDDRIPEEALRLAIDDASFGANGLSNSSSELLRLLDADGRLKDSTTTVANLGPDTSWERARDGPACSDCWGPSPPGAASPGGLNASRPRQDDLGFLGCDRNRVVVEARGLVGFHGVLNIELGIDPCRFQRVDTLAGEPGQRWYLEMPAPPLFGWNPLELLHRSSSGEGHFDTLLWAEPAGRRLGVDEVSNTGVDWAELRLEGDCPCLLEGLRLSTRSSRDELAGLLPAGGRLLLGPEPPACPGCAWFDESPVLARDGSLRLETTGGRLVEAAQWPATAGIWQRLGFDRPAEDSASWSLRPGTPGCPPCLTTEDTVGVFRISGRVLERSGGAMRSAIRVDGPPSGFALEIWSRSGVRRLRRDCAGREALWDGRDGDGAELPAGIWLLRLRTEDAEWLGTIAILR